MKRSDFRPFMPEPGMARGYGKKPRKHAAAALQTERAQGLFGAWEALNRQPFKGITTDGNDYGMDLLRLHYENAPHHRHDHRHNHA